MEPNFKEKQSENGLIYRGEAFPLDQTLIQRAGVNRSKRYQDLIRQHEQARKERIHEFYQDVAILLGTIVAIAALITYLFSRKK